MNTQKNWKKYLMYLKNVWKILQLYSVLNYLFLQNLQLETIGYIKIRKEQTK